MTNRVVREGEIAAMKRTHLVPHRLEKRELGRTRVAKRRANEGSTADLSGLQEYPPRIPTLSARKNCPRDPNDGKNDMNEMNAAEQEKLPKPKPKPKKKQELLR
jgi:hypothetical protein